MQTKKMIVAGNDEIGVAVDSKIEKHIVLRIDANLELFTNHN